MADDIEIITTADGSSSLYLPHLNETYHSRHGAEAESQYVYIDRGLDYLVKKGVKEFNILEMGFGTGLNAILTYLYWNNRSEIKINYTTVEKYPLATDIIVQLNFDCIKGVNAKGIFLNMHQLSWGVKHEISQGFSFTKLKTDITLLNDTNTYNLVYYDAFAPSKQPELWDIPVLEKVKTYTQQGAVLVTYCAQGQFKRNLKQLGFELDILKGPLHKAEMTRAILV